MASPAPIRLVALDMDGTLLAPDGTLSAGAASAVAAVRAAGAEVVLASGRPNSALAPTQKELGLSSPSVTFNGALAAYVGHDGAVGRVLRSTRLGREAVEAVAAACGAAGAPVLWCDEEGMVATAEGPEQEALLAQFVAYDPENPPTRAASFDGLLEQGKLPLKLVAAVGSQDRAEREAAAARALLPGGTAHVIAAEIHVEFVSPCTSKWAGLEAVLEELGVSPEEVLAFGDNNNDVEMLAAAGQGVAMPNGVEAARAAAARVAEGSNAEGGVAREIEAVLAVPGAVGGPQLAPASCVGELRV